MGENPLNATVLPRPTSPPPPPLWQQRALAYRRTVDRNRWLPFAPNPKQRQFLLLSDLPEVLYGGAAGGGKSIALLMAALQYVDHAGYHALLLRRTFPMLEKPGALMDLSKEWLSGTSALWNEQKHRWTFPSGSTLTFGHMVHENNKYDYQGPQYSFVGFDELTQFTESQYRYLFSRMRRRTGSSIPIRMRAASNPGGLGHDWVKQRFLVERSPHRLFLPAKLEDNPGLDREAYLQSLAELDPITRQQLLDGNWDAVWGGRFRREWLQWWKRYGPTGYRLGERYLTPDQIRLVFITVDPAASIADTADYTVISVWSLTASGDLLWLDCVRGRWEVPDIPAQIVPLFERYRCTQVCIEGGGTQKGVYQLCQRHPRLGFTAVREVTPEGKDKLVRATPAMNLASSGKLWVPADNPPWLDTALGELLRFTGDPKQDAHDDIVDTLGYAALVSRQFGDSQAQGFAPYIAPFQGGAYR